jgi:uncharacterized protein YkwD
MGSSGGPRRPLLRGFDPASYPTEPLVSYQTDRQLSGWNFPPLVIRALVAPHLTRPLFPRREERRGEMGMRAKKPTAAQNFDAGACHTVSHGGRSCAPIRGWAGGMRTICFLIGFLVAVSAVRADDIAAITIMISQYRQAHGLPAVKINPKLTAVAERQAKAMAASGIMDHNVAGAFSGRIAGADVDWSGENIAAGTKTWPDTLRIWKESPGHNANLLLAEADSLGVAMAANENTRYKTYWAMVIGHHHVKRRPGSSPTYVWGGPAAPAGGERIPDDGPSIGDAFARLISPLKSLLP